MKINNTYLCVICVICFFSPCNLWSKTAEDCFFQAGKKYIEGNTKDAISDLEEGLKLSPNDAQAKDFLILCLNEIALKYYIAGEYEIALPYLEKLVKLFPNPEVTKMLNRAEKWMGTVEKGLPEVPLLKRDITPVEKTVSKSQIQIQKQKEELVEQKGLRKEILKEVLTKAEVEMTKISSDLQRVEERIISSIDNQKKELKKTYIFYSVGTVFVLGGFIFFLVLISSYISHKRFKLFQEKLFQYSGKAPSITYNTDSKEEIDRIMADIDDRTKKIYGIDIIDAELVSETDISIGEKLLQPFLEDDDVLVRAKAFQSLWKYNPAKTIASIKTMLQDSDTSVKSNAIEILKGIPSSESVEILLELAKTEHDGEIKREVIKVLTGIQQKKEISLPQELSQKVEKFIQESKKEWIIS